MKLSCVEVLLAQKDKQFRFCCLDFTSEVLTIFSSRLMCDRRLRQCHVEMFSCQATFSFPFASISRRFSMVSTGSQSQQSTAAVDRLKMIKSYDTADNFNWYNSA